MKFPLPLILAFFWLYRSTAASVTLAWDPPDQGLPVTYTLYVNAESKVWQIEGIKNLSITVTNLTAGVKHMFQIVAVNDFGPGPLSSIISFTPSIPIEIDIPVMKPPTNIVSTGVLFGSGSAWTLGLKWTDQSTNSIGFAVRSRRPDGTLINEIKTVGRSVQIGQLPFASTNVITIAAFDALGNQSPESEPLSVWMNRAVPSGLRAVKYETVFQLP